MELSTETTASPKTQAKAASIDLITVVSIAVVVALLDSIIHEALGHGLVAILLGLHPRQVSTTYLDVSYAGVLAWKSRIVDAAGCGAELIAALIGFALMGFVRKSKANLRFFLWLFTCCNIFAVGGYLMVPTFLGFGDWESFVQSLPSPMLWKLGLEILGLIISCSGLYLGVRGLDGFSGRIASGPGSRRRRRARLIYTSYLSIGVASTIAAIFNPLSPQLILLSGAAATFGGNAFMLFMLAFGHKSSPTTPEHPMTPTRSWLWLCLGLVALFIEFVVLAPGLPR
ncbi:MAG: hypothetical protein ACYDER_29000 [Ktedonobacteraceae bacterium]